MSLRRRVDPGQLGVSATFLGHALVTGSWGARIPAIKHTLALTDPQLGAALFGMALGTLAGGRLGGRIAARFGARAVVRVGLPLYALALITSGLAGSLAALAVCLVAMGVMAAVVDVSMNSEAVIVERGARRPLMSGFHGMWSVGLMIGALVGAAFAAAGAGPDMNFVTVALITVAATAPILTKLPEREIAADALAAHAAGGWSLAVIVFGLITFCSFFAEGVAGSWGAVYLHDRVAAGAALAAVGFAAFSLGMAGSRLTGDRLAAAVGPVRLVFLSTLGAICGLTLALAVPQPVAGIVGFALLGLGLGPVVPTVVSAASGARLGSVEGVVSRVFTLGYVGGVSGPALIGVLAGAVGLRLALLVPLALVVAICASSGRLATAAGGPR